MPATTQTHCCFCGDAFADLWSRRYQLFAVRTGEPLDLYVCASCAVTASLSGYTLTVTAPVKHPDQARIYRRRLATVALIFAAVVIAALIITVTP